MPSSKSDAVTKQDLQNMADNIVNGLMEYLKISFSSIDSRFDGLENRVDRVEKRLEKVESRLVTVETRLEKVESRLETVETRLLTAETRLEKTEKSLLKMQNDIVEFKDEILGEILTSREEMTITVGHRDLIADLDERVEALEVKVTSTVH